jgi:hypothetical protein
VFAGSRRQARDQIGYAAITAHAERDAGECCRGVLERSGARDEIGFRIEFNDRARCPLHRQAHKPFTRYTVDLACSFRDLGVAQTIDRAFQIALRLRQGIPASDHTRTGFVSELLHEACADCGHVVFSVVIKISGDESEQRGGGIDAT